MVAAVPSFTFVKASGSRCFADMLRMSFLPTLILFLSALLLGATALPQVSERSSHLTKRCDNSATDRSCWGDYDLTTDYYNTVPDTGVTVTYYLEITNTTASPDGFERQVLLINGTMPGPTIEANWGDTVVVHLINKMPNNGSTFHFHGIRQNYTTQNDGVPGVTQCPVAPGQTYTYTWRATQYGSTWYHSHFSLQAWEGVFGGIVIHGPASGNYDEDLGSLFLNDWSHLTVDELFSSAETAGPPTMTTGLINGTGVYNNSGVITGTRFETTFTSGTKYLLRIVNAAIDTHFKFSIDNHTLTVIANDLVPLQPYTTDVLSIGIAQRYDVIVEANQVVGDYWMRATPQLSCSDNDNTDNIKGIVRYDASSTTDPTSIGYNPTDDCDNEPDASLVPYLSKTVGPKNQEVDAAVTLAIQNGIFKWNLYEASFLLNWSDPTLLQIYDNQTTFNNTQEDVIILDGTKDDWFYMDIETSIGVTHPIHLHGHDFYVLNRGAGTWDGTTVNLDNPPRRDVMMLPASGHMVIAFQLDNPGSWLMHCHIGWHQSLGLALQFVERQSEIPPTVDSAQLHDTCSTWDTYFVDDHVVQEDSGI